MEVLSCRLDYVILHKNIKLQNMIREGGEFAFIYYFHFVKQFGRL